MSLVDYCPECGEREDWRTHRCINTSCPTNKVDWDRPLEAGPVRMPTRAEALADSRSLRWQPIETLPDNQPVILTRQGGAPGYWLLARHDPTTPPYIYGRKATHWCLDVLGVPVA